MPDELNFDRMGNYNDNYTNMDYEEFINWNRTCFNELLNPDFAWLQQLCKRVTDNKISVMDMESGVEFRASYVYFDQGKNICIGAAR
jgi:hypothetical protein